MTSFKKKALVVDDSAFMRKLITDILNSHPKIEVVGVARNGKDALDKIATLKPDVITLDIEMPIMDGLEALQEIMKKHPTPVVMLSSTTKKGAENTMLAMEYGAVDFIAKPGGAISLNLGNVKGEIIAKIFAAANVSLSKLKTKIEYGKTRNEMQQTHQPLGPTNKANRVKSTNVRKSNGLRFKSKGKKVVVIGTSTGGPRALQKVLTQFPKDIEAPILIVQHMPPGFTKSLAERLNNLCEITVKEAENGDLLENGTAYLAPGGQHFTVRKLGMSFVAQINDKEPPRLGHRPSVNVLFESVAEFRSLKCLAVIMTGMGNDGLEGVKRLKENCETITIAESKETSVVYGMPRAIVDHALADEVAKLENIGITISEIIQS
ncbi:chemotaxis response regulator protein-glutamate methylesterase [Sporosarcina pasteurii]|nr:chemotaxis response regulator protein-glutamate methylesterase [Sporosarcina pasteurii]MDS9470601.1 chemotaxis response regulator protein-glutamate methylesterase [Sporosarcina pasteurii]QBQ07102.1 chemotaxis response regulator protein-glutamate methylesterase [Sporosarcina pasteurii]